MSITRRDMLWQGAGAALLCVLPVSTRAAGLRVRTGPAFGSAWRLVMPETKENPRPIIEAVVSRIDSRMSPYRRDSELARFNERAAATLSADTKTVADMALTLARDSDGAFDPTTAPLGRRYGFGPLSISPAAPAGHYRDIRLEGSVLSKAKPGLTFELNAVAKGYALDEMTAALDGLDFVLELGGEVAARGQHPSGRPWRFGIERPGSGKLQRLFDADKRVLATSGDGTQNYRWDGRRYGHVIDPRTGAPVDNGVASVSVLAGSGLLADGLATAALVLGPDACRGLLASYNASALFLMQRKGGFEEVDVGGFVSGGRG